MLETEFDIKEETYIKMRNNFIEVNKWCNSLLWYSMNMTINRVYKQHEEDEKVDLLFGFWSKCLKTALASCVTNAL